MGEAEGTIRRHAGGCTPLAHGSGEQLCNLALKTGFVLSCCDAGMAILTGTGLVAIPSELQHHTPTRGAISLPLGAAAPYPYPWSLQHTPTLDWSHTLPLECSTLGVPVPLGAAAPHPYPWNTATPWSCCTIPLPLELRQPSRQGYSRRSVECSTLG